MNTPRTLIAASLVALFAATGAFAQEATPDVWTPSTSTLTRAEVRADTAAAAQAGYIVHGEASPSTVAFVSTKSRAQVVAETAEARRLGLLVQGERSAPSISPAQAERIQMAGLRALSAPVAQLAR